MQAVADSPDGGLTVGHGDVADEGGAGRDEAAAAHAWLLVVEGEPLPVPRDVVFVHSLLCKRSMRNRERGEGRGKIK